MSLIMFDFKCEKCGLTFEAIIERDAEPPVCIRCQGETKKLMSFRHKPNLFPDGHWRDISPDGENFSSKRQLRDYVKKRNDGNDEFSHVTVPYLDGYGGY